MDFSLYRHRRAVTFFRKSGNDLLKDRLSRYTVTAGMVNIFSKKEIAFKNNINKL